MKLKIIADKILFCFLWAIILIFLYFFWSKFLGWIL